MLITWHIIKLKNNSFFPFFFPEWHEEFSYPVGTETRRSFTRDSFIASVAFLVNTWRGKNTRVPITGIGCSLCGILMEDTNRLYVLERDEPVSTRLQERVLLLHVKQLVHSQRLRHGLQKANKVNVLYQICIHEDEKYPLFWIKTLSISPFFANWESRWELESGMSM